MIGGHVEEESVGLVIIVREEPRVAVTAPAVVDVAVVGADRFTVIREIHHDVSVIGGSVIVVVQLLRVTVMRGYGMIEVTLGNGGKTNVHGK